MGLNNCKSSTMTLICMLRLKTRLLILIPLIGMRCHLFAKVTIELVKLIETLIMKCDSKVQDRQG